MILILTHDFVIDFLQDYDIYPKNFDNYFRILMLTEDFNIDFVLNFDTDFPMNVIIDFH